MFAPGQAASWNQVANLDASVSFLHYWGWIGVKTAPVGLFGYQIDKNEALFDAAWIHVTEDAVINAAKPTGCETASRMMIKIDLAGLSAGEHTVNVFYKAGDGAMVTLTTFTVNIA